MKDHVGITIDRELLREIEEARGREKRSTFMEYLLRLGLKAYQQQGKAQKQKEPSIYGPNGEPWR
jgi:metal-responsive CopG/Arc/MetJ family transcriptional regulator